MFESLTGTATATATACVCLFESEESLGSWLLLLLLLILSPHSAPSASHYFLPPIFSQPCLLLLVRNSVTPNSFPGFFFCFSSAVTKFKHLI